MCVSYILFLNRMVCMFYIFVYDVFILSLHKCVFDRFFVLMRPKMNGHPVPAGSSIIKQHVGIFMFIQYYAHSKSVKIINFVDHCEAFLGEMRKVNTHGSTYDRMEWALLHNHNGHGARFHCNTSNQLNYFLEWSGKKMYAAFEN